jgi:hypothetical protein
MNSFVKAALVLFVGAICGAVFFASTTATMGALLTGLLFLAAKAAQTKSAKSAQLSMQRIPKQISRQQRPPQRY